MKDLDQSAMTYFLSSLLPFPFLLGFIFFFSSILFSLLAFPTPYYSGVDEANYYYPMSSIASSETGMEASDVTIVCP